MKKSLIVSAFFLGLLIAFAAVPASAGTLYDNSTVHSYTVGAEPFSNVFAVSDSFTLASDATVVQIMFGDWVNSGYTLSSFNWAITTGAFSGSTLASGTVSSLDSSTYVGSLFGYDMYSDVFSISGLPLTAGTYYLQLGSAVTSGGNNANTFWDESDGSSSSQGNGDTFPSETFALYGNSAPPVPEPSSLWLLGSGRAGLAGLIKRKLRA